MSRTRNDLRAKPSSKIEAHDRSQAPTINWMDVLWLVLLAGLALLPPVREYHKQLILLAFGVDPVGRRLADCTHAHAAAPSISSF